MEHKKPHYQNTKHKQTTKKNTKKQITQHHKRTKNQPLTIKTKTVQKTIRTHIKMQNKQMQTNKQQKNKRQHYMQNMTLQQRKILNKITTPKPTHKQRTKQWYRCK